MEYLEYLGVQKVLMESTRTLLSFLDQSTSSRNRGRFRNPLESTMGYSYDALEHAWKSISYYTELISTCSSQSSQDCGSSKVNSSLKKWHSFQLPSSFKCAIQTQVFSAPSAASVRPVLFSSTICSPSKKEWTPESGIHASGAAALGETDRKRRPFEMLAQISLLAISLGGMQLIETHPCFASRSWSHGKAFWGPAVQAAAAAAALDRSWENLFFDIGMLNSGIHFCSIAE